MHIIIKSTNLDLTPAIKEYIEEKIGSLDRFIKKRFEGKSEIRTEVEIARTTKHHRHGDVFYAEVNLHLPKKNLRVEHSDWDIRIAIDKTKDKLQREIKKYKEKRALTRVNLKGRLVPEITE
ncbi:MAG: ribosome-associated translation inhibitor RaiA [Patescibacteria group bacterium]